MLKHTIKLFFALILTGLSLSTHAIKIDTEAIFLSQLSHQQYHVKERVTVNNSQQLFAAIKLANAKGNLLIQLSPGKYSLDKTISITNNQISIVAIDKNPFNTILSGKGMRPSRKVNNLIRISGNNFLLDGVTLKNAGNHLLQIAGEQNAKAPIIRNSVFQNSYEQLLKVTYDFNRPGNFSSHGIIENCLFRYTAGIGPQYYIGGIDAHAIQHWTINNNVFENIASPSKRIAEHAIHIWNNAAHNKVTNNLIINSDRGIGFGMRNRQKKNYKYGHLGGLIRDNVIYHADNNHPFADTGIILEESPETNIISNIILLEHSYRSAIEYRFPQTENVLIAENVTNKRIKKRDGGSAILHANVINNKQAKDALTSKLKNYIVEPYY